jgi:rhodanese-related sulfurtransferase
MSQGEAPAPPAGSNLREWEISPRDVARLLNERRSFVLLDCRRPDEFDVCRIEGAQLVPMQDLDLHLPRLRGRERDLIVVYCHTGRRSRTVTLVLRDQGFTNARTMVGGIERWSLEIDPSVPRY